MMTIVIGATTRRHTPADQCPWSAVADREVVVAQGGLAMVEQGTIPQLCPFNARPEANIETGRPRPDGSKRRWCRRGRQ